MHVGIKICNTIAVDYKGIPFEIHLEITYNYEPNTTLHMTISTAMM